MFEKKVWNDRQSEHPARRRLTPTENDNEYEVSRAEGLVMEEGDAFDATTMNDLENRVAKAFAEYDPAELGAVNVTVQLYTCKKEGKVYQLTGSGAVGRCKIPAAWASGDTWTVNGTTVPAYCGADAVDGDTIVAGRWAIFTFDGQQLNLMAAVDYPPASWHGPPPKPRRCWMECVLCPEAKRCKKVQCAITEAGRRRQTDVGKRKALYV